MSPDGNWAIVKYDMLWNIIYIMNINEKSESIITARLLTACPWTLPSQKLEATQQKSIYFFVK